MTTALVVACIWFGCPDPTPPPISPEEIRLETASHSTIHRTSPPPAVRSDYEPRWPGDVEQWRPLVAGHFPPDQVETALCVINGESGGNPNAKNRSSSAAGLWQFIRSTWDDMVRPHLGGPSYAEGGPYDPELATLYAAWLWQAEGWTQWSAYRHCR